MSADANTEGHADWVDRLQHRTRIYITINENDSALKLSAMHFGALQKVRLGHYTKNLSSERAVYLDFTQAKGVSDDHAYFEGKLLAKNPKLKKVFNKMFNGQTVEEDLTYDSDSHLYRIP